MIVITGATGFVGSNLSKYFSSNGFVVSDLLDLRNVSCRDDISARLLNQTNSISSIIHLAGKAHDFKSTTNPQVYYHVNTELTKKVYDVFLVSKARVFVTLSSVKAVADAVQGELTEDHIPNPITHYGKSKLLAEEYILSKKLPEGKRVFILRPCMIHGPGNKGNLNLLYNLVSKGWPWPLGAFNNKRSFCSIDNLLFIIRELIEREDIPSGIYNIADNEPISTNSLISLMARSMNKNDKILKISPSIINFIAKFGDHIKLPLNSERLGKLTENYIVSNEKLLNAIGKELPVNAIDGMNKTLISFNK